MEYHLLWEIPAGIILLLASYLTPTTCIPTIQTHPHWDRFIEYQIEYNKFYEEEEIDSRFMNFIEY